MGLFLVCFWRAEREPELLRKQKRSLKQKHAQEFTPSMLVAEKGYSPLSPASRET
jgi:hypothetical protein